MRFSTTTTRGFASRRKSTNCCSTQSLINSAHPERNAHAPLRPSPASVLRCSPPAAPWRCRTSPPISSPARRSATPVAATGDAELEPCAHITTRGEDSNEARINGRLYMIR